MSNLTLTDIIQIPAQAIQDALTKQNRDTLQKLTDDHFEKEPTCGKQQAWIPRMQPVQIPTLDGDQTRKQYLSIPTLLNKQVSLLQLKDATVNFNVTIEDIKIEDIKIDTPDKDLIPSNDSVQDEDKKESFRPSFDVHASLVTSAESQDSLHTNNNMSFNLTYTAVPSDTFNSLQRAYTTELGTQMRNMHNLKHLHEMPEPTPEELGEIKMYFQTTWRAKLTTNSDEFLSNVDTDARAAFGSWITHIRAILKSELHTIQSNYMHGSDPCFWHPTAIDIALRETIYGIYLILGGKETSADALPWYRTHWNSRNNGDTEILLQIDSEEITTYTLHNRYKSDESNVIMLTTMFPFIERVSKNDEYWWAQRRFRISYHRDNSDNPSESEANL